MFPFVIGITTLSIIVRWLHSKSFVTLLTGRIRFDLSRTLFAILVVGTMSAISHALELFTDVVALENRGELIHNRISCDWAALAFFALILVPLQVGLEEILFRGYPPQVASLVSRSKIFLLFSKTIIFTAVHTGNPEPWEYGMLHYLFSVFTLGTLMVLITLMDGGLELAIGFHTANNLWSFFGKRAQEQCGADPCILYIKNIKPKHGSSNFPDVNTIVHHIYRICLAIWIFF